MSNTQVSQEELTTIQELNAEFNKAKMAIGDVELQKLNIVRHIEELKAKFTAHEQQLVEKYGADAVINIQTGEVTHKTE
jgi:hypothetical protein